MFVPFLSVEAYGYFIEFNIEYIVLLNILKRAMFKKGGK